MGLRSPDPRLVRYFDERCRLMELTDPTVAEEAKRLLVAEGPRCSREDEAHALSLCEAGLHWSADPEAQAALDHIKQSAESIATRLLGTTSSDVALAAST